MRFRAPASAVIAILQVLIVPPAVFNQAQCAPPKQQTELVNLTAKEAVDRLCSGQITSYDYTSALLEQIELHACLNSFAALEPRKVLAEAQAIDASKAAGNDTGPLCGLPFAVKDNIDVVGYATVARTPGLEGMRPTNSSPVITRLLEAHGIVLGKTNMEELAEGMTTINPVYGPVLNPYNNLHDVGGSSGGTAGAIASRGVAGGFCSDTAGSCRIPGAHTGTVGFRPSLNCYHAAGGIVPQTTSRDTVGVMARTVEGVIMFDDIFSKCSSSRQQVKLNGTRLGYPINYWEGLDPKAAATFEAALKRLKDAGVEIVEFDMGLLIAEGAEMEAQLLVAYEAPRELARYMATHGYNISVTHLVDQIASPYPKKLYAARTTAVLDEWPTPPQYYHNIREVLPKITELYRRYLDAYRIHVTISPTARLSAGPIDQVQPWVEHNGKLAGVGDAYGLSVYLGPPLGLPAINIPVGLDTAGLPLGIQLQARPGEDDLLLMYSAAVEKVLPPTPAPPATPACQGCTPRVDLHEASYSGSGDPQPGDVTSFFSLHFDGECSYTTGRADSDADLQCKEHSSSRSEL